MDLAPFLFDKLALQKNPYIELWKSLDADYTNPEVVRKMSIQYPVPWVK